jgi:murein DD-endopeptidase MepM/ murein hydrolase activator NlpD
VREHHAIDIMAPRGTPVIAAAAGTVEKLFESQDGGHTIYIRRTDPVWIDYYAHLDTYVADLREGLVIRAGQQIGTVGSTGDADPGAPHLHYEIKQMAVGVNWWQGKNINPYSLLRGPVASSPAG